MAREEAAAARRRRKEWAERGLPGATPREPPRRESGAELEEKAAAAKKRSGEEVRMTHGGSEDFTIEDSPAGALSRRDLPGRCETL